MGGSEILLLVRKMYVSQFHCGILFPHIKDEWFDISTIRTVLRGVSKGLNFHLTFEI